MSAQVQEQSADLDRFVDAFERACAGDCPDLGSFLPPLGHPRFDEVLRELIRIDLEHSWRRAQPTTLDEYARRFPVLLTDKPTLSAVAFEEYRQRRLAGS